MTHQELRDLAAELHAKSMQAGSCEDGPWDGIARVAYDWLRPRLEAEIRCCVGGSDCQCVQCDTKRERDAEWRAGLGVCGAEIVPDEAGAWIESVRRAAMDGSRIICEWWTRGAEKQMQTAIEDTTRATIERACQAVCELCARGTPFFYPIITQPPEPCWSANHATFTQLSNDAAWPHGGIQMSQGAPCKAAPIRAAFEKEAP